MGLKRCTYRAFHDVTGQLWWCQNARLENTVLGGNGEMSDRWLFSADLCVKGVNYRVKDKIDTWLPMNNDFRSPVKWFAIDFRFSLRHLWKPLANRRTRDHKLVIQSNLSIILYANYPAIQRGQSLYYLTLNYKSILFPDTVFFKFHSTFLHVV